MWSCRSSSLESYLRDGSYHTVNVVDSCSCSCSTIDNPQYSCWLQMIAQFVCVKRVGATLWGSYYSAILKGNTQIPQDRWHKWRQSCTEASELQFGRTEGPGGSWYCRRSILNSFIACLWSRFESCFLLECSKRKVVKFSTPHRRRPTTKPWMPNK